MSNNYLMKSYSQHYLQILDRHVLQVHKYWADTSPKQWADLMERFWDLFALPPADLDLRTVATILNKIIICSAAQSHSVLLLRSRFPVLTDAFNIRDLPKNVDLHKELLQLAITVCQQSTCLYSPYVVLKAIGHEKVLLPGSLDDMTWHGC
ncbi:unnamed protein product, partial [Timema podura]|nr:unnamed protein product [Timema podura]